jgi:hypothetical protein
MASAPHDARFFVAVPAGGARPPEAVREAFDPDEEREALVWRTENNLPKSSRETAPGIVARFAGWPTRLHLASRLARFSRDFAERTCCFRVSGALFHGRRFQQGISGTPH